MKRAGAGRGPFKIYTSAATIVDVEPARASMVTCIFDLRVNPRELRTMPSSPHVFDRADMR